LSEGIGINDLDIKFWPKFNILHTLLWNCFCKRD